MSHIVPSSSGSCIPRKLTILSVVKLLLLEVSSFSGIVSGYHGSCLGDMVGVQSFSLQHASWLRFATLYQSHVGFVET